MISGVFWFFTISTQSTIPARHKPKDLRDVRCSPGERTNRLHLTVVWEASMKTSDLLDLSRSLSDLKETSGIWSGLENRTKLNWVDPEVCWKTTSSASAQSFHTCNLQFSKSGSSHPRVAGKPNLGITWLRLVWLDWTASHKSKTATNSIGCIYRLRSGFGTIWHLWRQNLKESETVTVAYSTIVRSLCN